MIARRGSLAALLLVALLGAAAAAAARAAARRDDAMLARAGGQPARPGRAGGGPQVSHRRRARPCAPRSRSGRYLHRQARRGAAARPGCAGSRPPTGCSGCCPTRSRSARCCWISTPSRSRATTIPTPPRCSAWPAPTARSSGWCSRTRWCTRSRGSICRSIRILKATGEQRPAHRRAGRSSKARPRSRRIEVLAPGQDVTADARSSGSCTATRSGSSRRAMPVFARAPLVVREALIFPYLDGAEFMHWWETRRPRDTLPYGPRMPVSTEQILHPERYARGDQPVPLAFPDGHGVALRGRAGGERDPGAAGGAGAGPTRCRR